MRAWQDRNGSLAGQKWDLGRTEMGAWQDRNGSLAGQKWEAWQKIMCKTGRTAWQGSLVQQLGRTEMGNLANQQWQVASLAEQNCQDY